MAGCDGRTGSATLPWAVGRSPAGPLAVMQGEPRRVGSPAPLFAYETAGGRLAWRADMPTFVQPPPVLLPGDVLVLSADLIYACATTG